MTNYKFLADEQELRFFWEYGIPTLKPNEVYFVSLSCRNKQLNEMEREFYKAGRSEMFAKQQIRYDDWSVFLQHIKRFEVRQDAYLTKSGKPYPQKSLVIYWNLANIDAYKAMKDQMNHLAEIMGSLTDAALKNSQGGLEEGYYKVRKSFDTAQSLFARNFGHREWIDFDCDAEDITAGQYQSVIDHLNADFGVGNVMAIKTAGGIHFLIRKSVVKINPQIVCNYILGRVPQAKEVVRNSNEMLPLPGTWQYENHVVTVMNKENFSEKFTLRGK